MKLVFYFIIGFVHVIGISLEVDIKKVIILLFYYLHIDGVIRVFGAVHVFSVDIIVFVVHAVGVFDVFGVVHVVSLVYAISMVYEPL